MEEPLSVQILDRLDSLNNADPAVHVFSVFTGIINFIRELKPTERAAALVYAVNNFGHRKPGVRTAAGEYPQLTIDNPDEADSHRLLADFADLRQWLSAEERQPLVVAARVWEIIQKQKYPERLTCVLLEVLMTCKLRHAFVDLPPVSDAPVTDEHYNVALWNHRRVCEMLNAITCRATHFKSATGLAHAVTAALAEITDTEERAMVFGAFLMKMLSGMGHAHPSRHEIDGMLDRIIRENFG